MLTRRNFLGTLAALAASRVAPVPVAAAAATCEWCHSDDGCDCAERIACTKAGTFGHISCGWCAAHDGPSFHCLCGVERFNGRRDDGDTILELR
jgi:hypothetical protein